LIIYLVGVVVALAAMRDAWPARIGTALVWPLGPVAFVVVMSMLLVASAIRWPLPVLTVAGLLAALGWWMT
jgi:hypothetical protein